MGLGLLLSGTERKPHFLSHSLNLCVRGGHCSPSSTARIRFTVYRGSGNSPLRDGMDYKEEKPALDKLLLDSSHTCYLIKK